MRLSWEARWKDSHVRTCHVNVTKTIHLLYLVSDWADGAEHWHDKEVGKLRVLRESADGINSHVRNCHVSARK